MVPELPSPPACFFSVSFAGSPSSAKPVSMLSQALSYRPFFLDCNLSKGCLAMLSITIPILVTPTLYLHSKLFSICCHAGAPACPDSTPHSLVLFQCSCEKHHYLLRVRARNLGVLLIICLPLTLPISKPLQVLAVLILKQLQNLLTLTHLIAATLSPATIMACLDSSVGLLPDLPAYLLVSHQPKSHDSPKDKDQSGFSRETEPTGYIGR